MLLGGVKTVSKNNEIAAAARVRSAFSWADAINQFPDLTTEEIASAACSVFGGRIFL